jgi:hypothetical protein
VGNRGIGQRYNVFTMKGYILRTWALWVRGLTLALLSVSLVALFTEYAHAQVVRFAKTYGGTDSDFARSVQQTSDGGYIVVGETRSFGTGGDILLIKTDANGNVIWAKTYGGANYDYAYSVQQTSDGGYILVGGTWSFGAGIFDIFLIKTDENGNIQWAKTYGGTREDYGFSFQQTSDGGYIVVGHTVSFGAGNWDVFLIKTDANGNVQWAKTYGGTDYDLAFSVEQTSDGGYIAAGYTRYVDIISSYYVFLVKTEANGNLSWAKTYGGGISDGTFSFQRTSDNGYIVAGWTYSFGAGYSDIFLIKTDANGSIGSCSIVQNVSPTVNNAPFSVTSLSPSVSSLSFTVNSVSPTVTSPTFTVSEPCPLSISESCQCVSGLITPYKGGIKITKSGEFDVKVYNVSGVMVKSVKGKNEVKIDLSKGVYFVEVVSGNRVLREKVLIR